MSARPNTAAPQERYSGCDMDDGFAYAGRRYQIELDREYVLSFYRSAAIADQWQAEGGNLTPVPSVGLVASAAVGCFHKQIDGPVAYLRVWFPSDLNVPDATQEPEDLYGIDLTGSHDGDAFC
jgi:hypothetical protein